MTEMAVRAHVNAINACNQRGGRMLSLVDLIDAGTVDLALGAYLAASMRAGASLLVGAQPGGAGKTAVMCALLNFLPDHTAISAISSQAVLAAGLRDERTGETCYMAHEIGAGNYYAYIWGGHARAFFRLAARGHIVASNLHADTLEQTQSQLCRENGVDPGDLAAVTLKLYLRVQRSGWHTDRRISHVYESDGAHDRLVWTGDASGAFTRRAESTFVSPDQEASYARLLDDLYQRDVRRIEDVRRTLLQRAPEDP